MTLFSQLAIRMHIIVTLGVQPVGTHHKVVAFAKSIAGFALLLGLVVIIMEERTIAPDALRKDELRAEFMCRGFTTDADSDLTTLLAKCKEVKLFEKPITTGYCSDGAEDEHSRVEIALHEFTDMIIEFQSTGVTDRQMRRLLHRLTHWKNRNSALSHMIKDASMLQVQQNRDKTFIELVNNLKYLKSSTTEINLGKDRSQVPVTEVFQTGDAPLPSILDLPNNLTDVGGEQPSVLSNGVLSPGRAQAGIFEQKPEHAGNFKFRTLELPNPVELLVKSLPIFDIQDAEQAFLFLKQLVIFSRQVRVFQITDFLLFQILFSHTKGALTKLITEAIQSQLNVQRFQELVIREFIPSRLFHSLLTKYYYRTQRSTERFLEFAEDIEIVREALLVPQTEAEAVRMVGVGARLPEVRSLFLGLFPPTSWRQLRQLGPILNDAAAAHQNLAGGVSFDFGVDRPGRVPREPNFSPPSSNRNFQNSRSPRQCTWCKKIGHSVDRCWVRLGRRPTNRPEFSANQNPTRNNNNA